eukprot:5810090-Amphidinium_carterae.1
MVCSSEGLRCSHARPMLGLLLQTLQGPRSRSNGCVNFCNNEAFKVTGKGQACNSAVGLLEWGL